MARRHHAVPIGRRLGTPVIAVADPGDLFAMDALRQSVGREFVAVVARPDQVERAIRQLYRPQDPEPEYEQPVVAAEPVDEPVPVVETVADAAPEPPVSSVAVADEPSVEDAAPAEAPAAEAPPAEGGDEAAGDTAALETAPLPDDSVSANGHGNGHGNGNGSGRGRGGRGSQRRDDAEADGGGTAVAEAEPPTEEAEAAASGGDDPVAADDPVDVMADVPPDLVSLADSLAPVPEPGEVVEDVPDEVVSVSLEESLREILSAPTARRRRHAAAAADEVRARLAHPDEAPPAADDDRRPQGSRRLPAGLRAGAGQRGRRRHRPRPAAGPGPGRRRAGHRRGDGRGARRAHQTTGESLARYLYNRKMATEEDLVEAMAQEVGLEFVDLSSYLMNPEAADLIPDAVARHHMVLPINILDGVPVVAMANPTDVFAMDDLRDHHGAQLHPGGGHPVPDRHAPALRAQRATPRSRTSPRTPPAGSPPPRPASSWRTSRRWSRTHRSCGT